MIDHLHEEDRKAVETLLVSRFSHRHAKREQRRGTHDPGGLRRASNRVRYRLQDDRWKRLCDQGTTGNSTSMALDFTCRRQARIIIAHYAYLILSEKELKRELFSTSSVMDRAWHVARFKRLVRHRGAAKRYYQRNMGDELRLTPPTSSSVSAQGSSVKQRKQRCEGRFQHHKAANNFNWRTAKTDRRAAISPDTTQVHGTAPMHVAGQHNFAQRDQLVAGDFEINIIRFLQTGTRLGDLRVWKVSR
ncbi:hypothetical protein BDZ88DRAFT_436345 [Geranomyces variabilis]|nr:hypothetical protein BDZ88DRAFT_436345 [Geranomyces variabilis]